jgi:hypothetical protein
MLKTGHLSRDEHSFAGCDHLADTNTLNARKHHYHWNSTHLGFAVNLRQTQVKSNYRKKADKLDAEYHQPGDATTFKSILNEYGNGGKLKCLLFYIPKLLLNCNCIILFFVVHIQIWSISLAIPLRFDKIHSKNLQ